MSERLAAGLEPEREIYFADLEDDGAYAETCKRGHSIRFSLQNPRYEILYESGIMAFHSGFHRESVASIVSALERFYEFGIRVLLESRGVPLADVDAAWKLVAKKSERQLGAFAFLFLAATKRAFVPPNKTARIADVAKFRNDVIHDGKIPTRAEALDFAKYVFEMVSALRAELTSLDKDAYDRAELRTGAIASRAALEKKAGPIKPDESGMYRSGGGGWVTTMLSEVEIGRSPAFEDRLASSAENLEMWGLGRPPGR